MTTPDTKPRLTEIELLRKFLYGETPTVPPLVDAAGQDILPESVEHETEEELWIDDPVHDIEAERAREVLATVCPPQQPVAETDPKLISFGPNSLKELHYE